MSARKFFPDGWGLWAVLLGLWLLFGLVTSGLNYPRANNPNHPVSFLEFQLLGLAHGLLWVGHALIVFLVARQFPLEQADWRYALLVHVPACILAGMLHLVLEIWVSRLFPLY